MSFGVLYDSVPQQWLSVTQWQGNLLSCLGTTNIGMFKKSCNFGSSPPQRKVVPRKYISERFWQKKFWKYIRRATDYVREDSPKKQLTGNLKWLSEESNWLWLVLALISNTHHLSHQSAFFSGLDWTVRLMIQIWQIADGRTKRPQEHLWISASGLGLWRLIFKGCWRGCSLKAD